VVGAVTATTGSAGSVLVVEVVTVADRVVTPANTSVLVVVLVATTGTVTVLVGIFKSVEQNADAEGTALKAESTRLTTLHSAGGTARLSRARAATVGTIHRRLESNILNVPMGLVEGELW
jgi:hypothetical protein